MKKKIYNIIVEMFSTPKKNRARFELLRHKLDKMTTKYVELTGSDDLREIIKGQPGSEELIQLLNVAYGAGKK